MTLKYLRVILCWVFVGACLADTCWAGGEDRSVVNCEIQQGSCTQRLNGHLVTLDVTPKPVKAMAELKFSVSYDGPLPSDQPYIDLNMLAMDMGENRVILKHGPRGNYTGKGVVVRCRSGIRTWSAKVTFPQAGTVEFIFDVIY